MFNSSTGCLFWLCVILGLVVGGITHWLVGLIFAGIVFYHAVIPSLIIDTASDALEYHHDRNDARAQKTLESEMYIRSLEQELDQERYAEKYDENDYDIRPPRSEDIYHEFHLNSKERGIKPPR